MKVSRPRQIDRVDQRERSFTTKVSDGRVRATCTVTARRYVSGIVQYDATNTSIFSAVAFLSFCTVARV
jgi:hypothetical protein